MYHLRILVILAIMKLGSLVSPQLTTPDLIQYHPILLFSTDTLTCVRAWLPPESALELKEAVRELVNIRNITYSKFRAFYKDCQKNSSRGSCDILYSGPFPLRWAFPSTVSCNFTVSSGNEKLVLQILRLYISFSALPTTLPPQAMFRKQIINRTISIFGEEESKNANRYVRVLSPNRTELIVRSINRTMRHFYNLDSAVYAITKIMIELVAWLNLTMILPNAEHPYDKEVLMTGIYPRILSTAVKTSTLHRGLYYERPLYAQVDGADLNFIYCAPRVRGDRNVFDMSPLLEPFDPPVWILVVSTVLLISFLISIEVVSVPPITMTTMTPVSIFFSVMWSLISAIISFPVFFSLSNFLRYSFLYMTWLLATVLLTNFYTGKLTSLLVEPIPEKTLETLEDLVTHNYSFSFSSRYASNYEGILESVDTFKKIRRSSAPNNYDYIEALLTSNPSKNVYPEEEFLQKMAYRSKTAAFGTWTYVLAVRNRVLKIFNNAKMNSMKRNETRAHGSNQESKNASLEFEKRKCIFGKKMMPNVPTFWGFYPPNAERLYDLYLDISRSGIETFWVKEYYGLSYAERVQDRARVKHQTEIEEDDDKDVVKDLSLKDSHFTTVIMLAVFCYAGTVMAFVGEILRHLLWDNCIKANYETPVIFLDSEGQFYANNYQRVVKLRYFS